MTELRDVVKDEYSSDSEAHVLLVSDESFVWDSDENSEATEFDKSRESQEDRENLISSHPKKTVLRVYRRRWLILGLFSLLSFMQCAVWNTWGPISDSCITAFPSWDSSTIALFSNWGTVTYVIFAFPLIWLYDLYGLRSGTLFSAFLMAVGTAIRCISTSELFFTWMAHIGANLNGIAGIVICSVPTAVSSLWFPPNERTTATALSTTFNILGNAGGFLLGPMLVREPPEEDYNNQTIQSSVNLLRTDILFLMQAEAVICMALFICVLVYFPSKPPLPPSLASTVQRFHIKEGLFHLLKNREVLLLTAAFSLSQGVLGVWLGIMNIHLSPFLSQVESGWLGVWAIVASCLLVLLIARLTDTLAGHMKLTITVLLIISSIAFTFLALMCLELMAESNIMIYLTVIVGSCANYAASPLFFELAAEVAFPVDEAIVGCFLSSVYNLVGAIFLFAFFIPDIGVSWINYCLVAAPAAALPFVFKANEDYRRSNLDKKSSGDKCPLFSQSEDEIISQELT